ncbi:hypothetical protein T8J41_15930 [Nitratireductor rhodophyticola]|uniref:hypothetical protein n=1 Tax=Nitratireductor rhodophyticola TaxID=2854036 RepID=UPI002AC9ECDB|nr:hypothetical protein [Nitratireductor rhodophyticola]WPZ13622.1 hypothetical protein T8J41_15930 [Nitratireductor rhodophyticola]
MRYEFEVPVTIPNDKAAARAWLNTIGVGAAVSMTAACANAGLPIDTGWRGELTERPLPAQYVKKRPAPANDNEPLILPIIEALRRDGREDDVPLITRYRMLVEVVGASPLDAEAGIGEVEGMNIEARTLKLSGKEFRKSFAKMTKSKLPGGEIAYKETRRTVKQRVSIGQRTIAANDNGSGGLQVPLRLARSEDERIAQIDGQPILAALRSGMGELCATFEDAALAGLTLTEIGEAMGFKWKARSREARVAVYTAIDRLREAWACFDREARREAKECERRVEAHRAQLAARRAAYLGLAA